MGKNGNGDCFEVAGKILLDAPNNTEMKLCHGIVVGQGPLEGLRIRHAWIESDNGKIVIDKSNGNDFANLAAVYYAVGRIDKNDVVKYSRKEMIEKILETEHWGSWDDKFIDVN